MCLVFILIGPGKYCNLSVDSIRWQYEVLMGSCVIDVVFEVDLAGTLLSGRCVRGHLTWLRQEVKSLLNVYNSSLTHYLSLVSSPCLFISPYFFVPVYSPVHPPSIASFPLLFLYNFLLCTSTLPFSSLPLSSVRPDQRWQR